MGEHQPGAFSEAERAFLEGIADELSTERGERFGHDLQIAHVRRDGDYLQVDLPGYERPEYRGHRQLPFEGRMYAADGGAMTVLVNMDHNDRFLEVEFIRWESLNSVAPDWSTLRIVPKAPMGVSKW